MCKINIAAYGRRTLPQDMSRRGSNLIITALINVSLCHIVRVRGRHSIIFGLTRTINEA